MIPLRSVLSFGFLMTYRFSCRLWSLWLGWHWNFWKYICFCLLLHTFLHATQSNEYKPRFYYAVNVKIPFSDAQAAYYMRWEEEHISCGWWLSVCGKWVCSILMMMRMRIYKTLSKLCENFAFHCFSIKKEAGLLISTYTYVECNKG